MAVSNLAENGSEKLIAKLLAEADIPVTEENIEEVKQAADIAVNAGKLNDSSESYLIKNGLAPTIGNIYKASHSGEMRTVKLDDASWEGLKTGALDIISEAGIDTEKGLESARWLVEHDIPVTAENISYKAELDEYNKAFRLLKKFNIGLDFHFDAYAGERKTLMSERDKLQQELEQMKSDLKPLEDVRYCIGKVIPLEELTVPTESEKESVKERIETIRKEQSEKTPVQNEEPSKKKKRNDLE